MPFSFFILLELQLFCNYTTHFQSYVYADMSNDEMLLEPDSKRCRTQSAEKGDDKKGGLLELSSKVSIEITNHNTLKQFIEVLTNLLSEVDFQIVHNPPTFTGLEVATLNASKSCMIQARFSSLLTAVDKNITSFCVDVNTLYNCLNIADPNQSVILGVEQDVVRFDVIQPNGMLNGASLFIPRKICEQDTWYFEQQDFKYTIKFKQTFFRKYIKILKNFKVDRVDFCLYRPPVLSSPPTDDIYTTQSLYFAFRGDSDDVKDICFWFHSTTKVAESLNETTANNASYMNSSSSSFAETSNEERGMRDICGHTYVTIEEDTIPPNTDVGLSNKSKKYVPHWDSMEELYRERFQTRYLDYFTKNIDRNDITIYMARSLPLVLHFPVGDTSYIRFVLMMCNKDDELNAMDSQQ